MLRGVFIFATVLVFVSAEVLAAEHPTPLQKDVDSAQCVTCHADKTKGAFVHTAISMGCATCHEVKNEGTVTSVTTVAKGNALCLTCHEDKGKAEANGNLHPPVAESCIKCHSPHSSPNKFQLVKPPSGDKDENLCLQCHDKGLNVDETGSRHAALDMGCDTCHVTHKTGDSSKKEFAFHLVKAPPGLCIDCHDAGDKQLKEAHRGQPFAQADCTECHDPHQSTVPKLMQKNVHFPFGEKMCDACHLPPKDGKIVLIEDGKFALCYTCHDEIKKTVESSKNPHPAFAMIDRCTECHSPHASLYPQMLKQPVDICTGCHTDKAEMRQKTKFLHQPAFKDGCYLCHEPHGSEHSTLLRTEQVNELCLTCHSATPKVEKSADSKTLTVFSGTVTLPGDYLDSVKRIAVNSSGKGHPLADHPVTGVADPLNPGQKLRCTTCHDPHGSDFSKRMFHMKEGQTQICLNCHGGGGKVK